MENRREVSARKINLFHQLAIRLVKLGFTPNQISILSSVFSLVSGLMFFLVTIKTKQEDKIWYLLMAIAGIQFRLICNLIDGLMAVEGGLKTKSGELFNDVPDRFSDVFIIVGAGYLANALNLSWIACLLAILTAYIRALGASLTGKHDFVGPMAKQNRMAVITLGTLGAVFEVALQLEFGYFMYLSLIVVALGSAITCIRRLYRIYVSLEKKN